VFERFTERAREVVVLAQVEARALKHNYIGTEHLLLGLLREEEGLAALVLKSLDMNAEAVRAQVAQVVGKGDEAAVGQMPFTPRTKKVLELSLREALALGHSYIGTEHILLGLVRENEGVAALVLLHFNADPALIRSEVIRMVSGPSDPSYDPSLRDPVQLIRAQKEAALERGQMERAAQLRDEERRLLREERRLLGEHTGDPAGARLEHSRWSARVQAISFLPGWVLFAVSLGIGVLIGWAIWGT
jgi:ATP-dependent Clp protease ATP-binding subunit ClpA